MAIKRVAIIVGEHSGDILGAELIKALKTQIPSLAVEGVLGVNLRALGCEQLYPMEEISVMGFIDPLLHLPKLLKIRSWLIKHFKDYPPDLFIAVDFPEFNLSIEKHLKAFGIPTVHYVSPSIWAWRKNRIYAIKKAVDLMLVLFPFEEQIYHDYNVRVKYVGHPRADSIPIEDTMYKSRKDLNLAEDALIIAILPGSRKSEIKAMTKIYAKTAMICAKKLNTVKFIAPLVCDEHRDLFLSLWHQATNGMPCEIIINNTAAVMSACDVALVTSGTATLELMLHKKPMVVAYKTNWLTYYLVKWLIQVKFIALPNLLSNDMLVPEYIQKAAEPEVLATALLNFLQDKNLVAKLKLKFAEMHKILQQQTSRSASLAICSLLGW